MCLDIKVGASMVKWTKKVLLYPKAIVFFLVKHLKVVAKCCPIVSFFMVTFIVVLSSQM